jgi:monoamine oxidase
MYDTLVIGAGMAGLSAARRLHDIGQRVAILEAQKRIGGRTWTHTEFADFPVEFGAEFIHGENAITHMLLKEAGLSTIPVDRYGSLRWGNPRALKWGEMPDDLRNTLQGLLETYNYLELEKLDYDTSLGDYLKQKSWNTDAIAKADILLAQTNCASIYTLSIQDLQRELKNSAGHQEFRIREGYQMLLRHLRRNLEIHLATPVSHIDWSTSGVILTALRQTFEAKTCIITVPVSILQNNTLEFSPALSQHKRNAIDVMKMEPGTKLIYKFTQAFWDDDLTYMLHQGPAPRWWTPGYGRKGANVICSFITADYARRIDALSEDVALELGLRDLSQLLDLPYQTLEANLVATKRMSWGLEPYTLGAYAHVPPGAAWAREVLAKPESNLFFAGEATAYHSTPQTVHGAIDSGIRAANEVLQHYPSLAE